MRISKRHLALKIAKRDQLLAEQENRCAICHQNLELQAVHVDHDHRCCTGNVRVRCLESSGIDSCVRAALCFGCNSMLGHAHDDPERLRAAAAFLEAWASARTQPSRERLRILRAERDQAKVTGQVR